MSAPAHNRIPRLNAGEAAFAHWCKMLGLPEPKQNYRFLDDRKWEIDFAWPQWKIGVEIQGGIWMAGRGAHSRPLNIMRDMEKHNALLDVGWHVWLFTPLQAKRGSAAQHMQPILRAAENLVIDVRRQAS